MKAAVGTGSYADHQWETIVGHYDYEMGTTNLGRHSRAESAVEYFVEHNEGVELLDLFAVALLYAERSQARGKPPNDKCRAYRFLPERRSMR